MPDIGEVKGTISLSDLLTPELMKANTNLEKFAQKLAAVSNPLGKLGGELKQYSDAGKALKENLKIQNAEMGRLLIAYKSGAEAVARTNTQIRIENELRRMGLSARGQQGQAIAREITLNDQLAASLRRSQQAAKESIRTKTTLFEKINSLRFGYFALSAAIGISINSIIESQRAYERIMNTLLTATGTAKLAGEEMGFIREQAEKFGLDLRTVGAEYARFAASAKNTAMEGENTRRVFVALATASTAMGLSAEQSGGALNALQQMISKATVQSEELRGQLSERIPGSFTMAAKAMGLTERAFNKQIEQGNILAVDLLPKLAEEWMKTFGPGAVTGAQTLNAEMNRLSTTLFDLEAKLSSDAGIKGMVKGFNDLLKVVGGPLIDSLKYVILAIETWIALNLVGWITAAIPFITALTARLWAMAAASAAAAGPIGIVIAAGYALNQMTKMASSGMQEDIDAMVVDMARLGDQTQNFLEIKRQLEEARAKGETTGSGAITGIYESQFNMLQAQISEAEAKLKKLIDSQNSASYEMWSQKLKDQLDMQIVVARGQLRILKETEAQVSVKPSADTSVPPPPSAAQLAAIAKYERALAKMLKAADPYAAITKELADNQKMLNLAISKGDILLKDRAAIERGLLEDATKAREALDKQTDSYKEWEKSRKNLARMYEEGVKWAAKWDKAQEDSAEQATKIIAQATVALLQGRKNAEQLEKSVEWENKLTAARKKGAAALLQVQRAMYIEQALLQGIANGTDVTTQAYLDLVARITKAAGELFDVANKDVVNDELVAQWSEVADIISGIDPELGKMSKHMVDMGAAIKQINLGAKSTTTQFENWASAIVAGIGLLKESGLIAGPGGGTGTMGGTMSGTFSKEGAIVGAVIGAAIAAYFTGGMGAGAGAALGSAIGEVFGSFIKKGADEGLSTLRTNVNNFGANYVQVFAAGGNKLSQALNFAGQEVADTLSDIVTALGGELKNIPVVTMKIRDDVITVWVNGLKRTFKEMGEAISYTITQILKSAEFLNMDALFEAVLRGSSSDNLEQLKSDLEAVQKVIDFGLTGSQQAINAFANELDMLRNVMLRTVGDSAQLARALANIGAEEIRRWQTSRDALTGDKRSNEERLQMLKADAQMWNAEKALRIAELQMKLQNLEAQKAIVDADAALNDAQLRNGLGVLETRQDFFEIERELAEQERLLQEWEVTMAFTFMRAEATMVQASMSLLDVQIAAIRQMIDALGNMPDIDIPSLHLPGGGGKKSGGKSAKKQRIEDFFAFLETIRLDGLTEMQRRIEELNKAFEEQARAAGEVEGGEQMLAAARLVAFQKIRDDFLETYRVDNLTEYQRAMEEMNQAFEDQALLADELTGGEEALAEARRLAAEQIRNDLLDSFGSPLEDLRDRLQELDDRMADYADSNAELLRQFESGEITAAQYADAIAKGNLIIEESALQLESQILSLASYFSDALGDTKQAAEFRARMAQLEWDYKKAELALMLLMLEKMGKLSDEARAFWENFMSTLPDLVPTLPNQGGGNTQTNNTDTSNPLLDALKAAMERLRNAVEELTQSNKDLLMGDNSPLTLQQQFMEAQRRYNETLAAAQGGDLTAIENFADVRDEYLALYRQMFGSAGANYAEAFAAALQAGVDLAAAGQTILDGMPAQMEGTEIRLDTIIQIQQAMLQLFGQAPPWNPNPVQQLPPHTLGSSGNVAMGDFGWSLNNRNRGDRGVVTVDAPGLATQMREMSGKLDAVVEATNNEARETKMFRLSRSASGLSGFYGTPIGGRRSA